MPYFYINKIMLTKLAELLRLMIQEHLKLIQLSQY